MGWIKGFGPLAALCVFASVASAVTPQEEAVEALNALNWGGPRVVLQVHKARVFHIPKQIEQDGPRCGFFALAHVFSRFDRVNAPKGMQLYETAKANDWLWQSEGAADGSDLFNTANHYGYTGEYGWGTNGGTIDYLKSLLGKGYGVVIAVREISDEGLPSRAEAFDISGHFVALEGFVTLRGTEYLIVKDGNTYPKQPKFIKEKLGGSSLWPVDLFEENWGLNFYLALKPKPKP